MHLLSCPQEMLQHWHSQTGCQLLSGQQQLCQNLHDRLLQLGLWLQVQAAGERLLRCVVRWQVGLCPLAGTWMKAMQAVLIAALVCWKMQVSDFWKLPLALTLAEEDCCVLAGPPSQGAALAELQQTARQCLQFIC